MPVAIAGLTLVSMISKHDAYMRIEERRPEVLEPKALRRVCLVFFFLLLKEFS